MRFVDASLFFNEVELFELRLRLLRDFVDLFYVVEGDREFTGKPRASEWLKHEGRFRDICPWIEYHFVKMPEHGKAWEREAHLRNALEPATEMGQWAILSDADEIPDPSALDAAAKRVTEDGFVTLLLRWAPYYLNGNRAGASIGGTAVCPTRSIKRAPERMRNERNTSAYFSDGWAGWHWTSLGGPQRIMQKLHAYSQDDPSRPDIAYLARPEIASPVWLSEAIEGGMDIFKPERRDVVIEYMDMNDARIPDAARVVAKDYPYLVHKVSA